MAQYAPVAEHVSKEPHVLPHQELRAAICAMLVTGAPRQAVIARAVEAGAALAEAEAIAQEFSVEPLLTLTRQTWLRLQCRDWWLGALASLDSVAGQVGRVDVRSSIGRTEFLDQYYFRNRPLHLPRAAAEWPAVVKWRGSDYLTATCGEEIIEVMVNRQSAQTSDQNTADALRRRMTLAEYVSIVEQGPSNEHYMVSRNRFFEKGEAARLLGDLGDLSIVNTHPAPADVRMWFGPAGTITPLHYDDRNNVIVQIVGTKKVRLYAPYDSEFMNQIQIWYGLTDPRDQPPQLSDRSAAEITLDLCPGDALFIPVGWWHALTAVDTSITLAFIDFGVTNLYAPR